MPIFNRRKAFDEGFATGFDWGAAVAYGSIHWVLINGQRPFDEGGHHPRCQCKPCELILEVLRVRRNP